MDQSTDWKPDGQAFCWQPKGVLHRIREALDSDNSVASALAAYVALTEIASDKRSHTFTTTHAFIAMRCGLSQRTVQQRIKDLVAIGGILECKVPTLKSPATYTLLSVKQSLPNDTQPPPRVVQSLPNDTQRSKKAPLPTSKEYQKNGSKEETKNPNKPVVLNPQGQRTTGLMQRCVVVFGETEMKRSDCHRRWYDRAVSSPDELERLLADVSKEHGLQNVAAYAETLAKDVYKI